jgi:hypothetical protein
MDDNLLLIRPHLLFKLKNNEIDSNIFAQQALMYLVGYGSIGKGG